MANNQMSTLVAAAFAALVAGAPLTSCHTDKHGGSSHSSSAEKHTCAGKNACKGQGGCQSGDNGCAGKNSCRGRGGCSTMDKNACGGKNGCKGEGGCGGKR